MKFNEKHCQKCGAEIVDAKAKKCAACGATIKTPFFKKWWFWVIVALGVIIIGSASGTSTNDGDAGSPSSNSTTYEVVDIQQMIDELGQNALKAENTYKNKYVQITGKIANFDSSGSYITIEAVSAGEFNFHTVMCYVKKDDQRNFLMEKSVGDVVTIKGKITSVGEVLGYSLNIDKIS